MKLVKKTLIEKRGWMLDDVQDKKITRTQNKEDGSICSFVLFPNGNIRAKSKTSFESDQAKMAQRIFDENSDLSEEVRRMLENGEIPIFEIVGPENQIVLSYDDTELILLQIRNNNGFYLSDKIIEIQAKIMGIKNVETYDNSYHDLDKLLSLKEIEENIEGWIITFEDGQMAKIKTNWYLQLHRLLSPNQFQENHLVETILDGNFDDIVSELNEGPKKEKFIELENKISHKFNELVSEFIKLRGEYYNKYQENRKEFALTHKNNPLFGSVMKTLNTSFRDVEKTAENAIKEYILRQCKTLSSAKEFVEEL